MSNPEDDLLQATQSALPPPKLAAVPSTPAPSPVAASAPPQKPIDTLHSDYMQHRDDMEGNAALEEMLASANGQKPAAGSAKPAAAAPAAEPPETSNRPPDMSSYVSNFGVAAKAAVGKVATDVRGGLIEGPRAALGGARDAFQSMIDGASDLGNFLQKKFEIPGIKVDSEGVHVVPESELEKTGDLEKTALTLPGVKEPSTVTGGVIHSASQFITSMATLGRVFGAGSTAEELLGRLQSAGKGAAAMFAGFEGGQRRLSDLIQSVPQLQNPVTEFLASKPDDSEAVGRLKNAVEGTVVGQLADGLVAGLRFLKGGMDAKEAASSLPPEGVTQPPPKLTQPKAFDVLGDVTEQDKPLVQVTPGGQSLKQRNAEIAMTGTMPEDVKKMGEPAKEGELAGPSSPGATEAQAKEPGIYVNFARIDTQDDVKRAMSQMVDAQAGDINLARRGIQTFEDTKLGADSKDAWATLMARRQGDPLNAEEMLAGRQLWAQSAMKTNAVMEQALAAPTPENLLAFRKQMVTHAMIQKEVVAARTEVARSLSAMRIPVGGPGQDRMSAIAMQVDQMGGLQSNLEFLQRAKGLADSGMLEDLGNVAEKSLYARTRDALLDGWTNGLLTNPMTHVKVALSNISTIALRLTETRIAESMDRLMGSQNGVAAGETAQTAAGLVAGLKDAFRYAGKLAHLPVDAPEGNALGDAIKAAKTGEYGVGKEQSSDFSMSAQGNISSEAMGLSDSGWLGKGMDFLGQVARSPGRALTAEHEFFRSLGMRMELQRYANRQAINEYNSGQLSAKDFNGRIAELVESPPPNMTTAAVNGMTYQTFTDAPGKLAEMIENLREAYPLTRVVLPFYKIPSRILSFTFERSPLAPLMSSFRANVSAGGARQSLALAQMGLGTSMMLATVDAVMQGQVTGAGPLEKGRREAMENEGWQPYSVKVGNRWVQYNRLETVGSSMAMAADVAETVRNYQTAVNADDPDVEKLTVAATLSVAQNITSKTYLQGLSRFFEAMADPRASGPKVLQELVGSAVPAGVSAIAKQQDPYNREVYSMMDAIKARTPGFSKDLPPQRNLWGEPVRHDSGLGHAYDAFVPFTTHQPKNEPIDAEMNRLGMNETIPNAKASFDGVNVNLKNNPQLYSRYQQLSGNELKHPAWDQGAKDYLNDLVTGKGPLSPIYDSFQDGADGGKAVMIKDAIRQFRELSRNQLLDESPELKDQVATLKDKQTALRGMQ